MRLVLTLLVCAAALAMGAGARAQDATQGGAPDSAQSTETLTHFLARCDAGDAGCRSDLGYGFEAAADDMGIICPPDNLSEDQAVDAELQWLRDAASSNDSIAAGDEVDAEYDALNALWPCGN